jgi:hypothetical protein
MKLRVARKYFVKELELLKLCTSGRSSSPHACRLRRRLKAMSPNALLCLDMISGMNLKEESRSLEHLQFMLFLAYLDQLTVA